VTIALEREVDISDEVPEPESHLNILNRLLPKAIDINSQDSLCVSNDGCVAMTRFLSLRWHL
jgi:hypothetical protein